MLLPGDWWENEMMIGLSRYKHHSSYRPIINCQTSKKLPRVNDLIIATYSRVIKHLLDLSAGTEFDDESALAILQRHLETRLAIDGAILNWIFTMVRHYLITNILSFLFPSKIFR